jgi:putative MFS transporter
MAPSKLTSYQRRLFVFLSVATFFEGYDFMALAQILPNLRADLGLSKVDAGLLFAFVNAGTIVAYPLIRKADRWGRRRVLMITIVGYASFTFATGLAPDVYTFGLCQFCARIFLIAEWATAMVYAAEEYPADRRGSVIGVLQAIGSMGAIVCAGVVPLLLNTTYGWRSVYLVGVAPLFILAYARRNLRETKRFIEQVDRRSAPRSLFHILRSPYRTRVLEMGLIWFLTYACSNTAISFWKDFAVNDRGYTDAEVGITMTLAALVSLPLIFFAGKLLDLIGRRRGAAIIFTATSVGVYLSYALPRGPGLVVALTVAIFGVTAVLPVLNAFTTELFPTELRGDAFAWSNNLLGRVGYVLSPILIGIAAEHWNWGAAVRPTAITPMLALVAIFLLLPETRNRELEETSALPEAPKPL